MKTFIQVIVAFGFISSAQAQWWVEPIVGVPTFKNNGTLLSKYPAILILDGINPESVKPEAQDRLQGFASGKPITCINKGQIALTLVLVSCTLGEQDLSEWLIAQNLATRGVVGGFRVSSAVNPVLNNSGNSNTSTNSFYATCTDARAAGVAPLKRGQPGYRSELDADGDGVACE